MEDGFEKLSDIRRRRAERNYYSLKRQLGLSKAEELVTVSSYYNGGQERKLANINPAVVLYYARYIVCQHKARLGYEEA